MEEKKRLSLCIITKNDEKYLSGSLEDMEEVADEVIIVDTGSTDKTIEIAQKAGAAVYRLKWKNDYSEAKNLCLDHANGRWVLFLKTYETISGEQLKELVSLLDNPNAEGYLLYSFYNSDECSIISPVQSLRLFRNRPEYRFQYRVYERIPDDILTNIEDSGIRIGLRDEFAGRAISGQQIRYLKGEMRNRPEDPYLQYMYGIMLLNRQRCKEGMAYFRKAMQTVNYEDLYAPHLLKCLSWSLVCLQRYDEALEALNDGIGTFSFYSDLLVLRGEVYMQMKQYESAVSDLKAGLGAFRQCGITVPAPEIDAIIILELLGDAYEQLPDYSQALTSYQQAYESDSNNLDLVNKIAEMSAKTGSAEI